MCSLEWKYKSTHDYDYIEMDADTDIGIERNTPIHTHAKVVYMNEDNVNQCACI